MIVLDENFPEGQRQLLRGWRIRIRQIGYEIGRKGMKDHELIPCKFDTDAKRMGTIIRVIHTGLWVWRSHAEEARFGWTE